MSADTRNPPAPAKGHRPLRIGIEAHVVGRRQTGNERVVANLIRAIREASDHVLVVYLSAPEAARALRAEALPRTLIRLIPAGANPFLRIPLLQPLAARRDRLDVFLAHVNAPPVAPCPVVTLVHDVAFARHPEYYGRFERTYMQRTVPWSLRRSRALVAVSEFTRDEIVALYGIAPGKITVARNGIDPAFLDPRSRPCPVEPPFFLAAGNLEPRKNLGTLIGAYRALLARRPDLPERLVLVGKEWFGSEPLRRQAGDLVESGRVVFTGHVEDNDLIGLLQGATALAYPSVYEGFGLPPLEAMAVGTPAIAADIPVMREVTGEAALLVPALDQAAWTEALARLSFDPKLRRDLAERGRRHAGSFTWEASARAVLGVLERAAAKGRPRRLG